MRAHVRRKILHNSVLELVIQAGKQFTYVSYFHSKNRNDKGMQNMQTWKSCERLFN